MERKETRTILTAGEMGLRRASLSGGGVAASGGGEGDGCGFVAMCSRARVCESRDRRFLLGPECHFYDQLRALVGQFPSWPTTSPECEMGWSCWEYGELVELCELPTFFF